MDRAMPTSICTATSAELRQRLRRGELGEYYRNLIQTELKRREIPTLIFN